MLYNIIVNEKEKFWQTKSDDEMVKIISTGTFKVGNDIVGQFEGEENKEQAENMLWKLRPDLNFRP